MRPAATAVPNSVLRQAREARGWTQEEVAEQLGTSGFTVCRWERGLTTPGPHYRQKLCALFQISQEALGLLRVPADPIIPQNGLSSVSEQQPVPFPAAPGALPVGAARFVSAPSVPPVPSRHLIGRDELLQRLKERLWAGKSVALCALGGLPGVGKTTLALALAHDPEVRVQFPDGVFWAGLGPAPALPVLLGGWATTLGMAPADLARLTSVDALSQAVHALIGPRQMLLVIDDAWRIEDALACKVGGPQCVHLLTTRSPDLAVQFAYEGAMTIQELSETDGLTLLARLAPEVVAQEPEQARALVAAVGGLPLALTLIGHFLQRHAFSGQPRRIEAALEQLRQAEARLRLAEPLAPADLPPHLLPGTPLSLEATIAVSDHWLNATTRAVLQALAVFPAKPGTFSEAAALAVCNAPVDQLDLLLSAGLLESAGPARYTLHQTVADYARLQGTGTAERAAAEERLVRFFVTYVEAHEREYPVLEQEVSSVLVALHLAFERGMASALVRGVNALWPFWENRGLYELATTHLQRAEEAARARGDQPRLIATLLHLGQTAERSGAYAQGERALREGLSLARRLGDEAQVCDLLYALGNIASSRGDYLHAEELYQEALEGARQSRDQERISQLLATVVGMASRLGKNSLAEALVQEGLALARQLGNQERLIALLLGWGLIEVKQGHIAETNRCWQEALALAREIGHRERIAVLLINLGALALEQGDNTTAEPYLVEGLMLARDLGHRARMASALANLGQLAINRQRYEEAEAYLTEGLTLAREIGHRENICALLGYLSTAALKQGHYIRAEVSTLEGLALARELHLRSFISSFLADWGTILLKQQRIDEAGVAFREALDLAQEIAIQQRIADALFGLAQVAAACGNEQDARTQAQESLQLAEAMGYFRRDEVKRWLTDRPT